MVGRSLSWCMMTSHSNLLLEVAQAIIDEGYAVRPTSLHVPHVRYAIRRSQLQAARARFEHEHGYTPRMWQLAIMCGVSKSTVSKALKS